MPGFRVRVVGLARHGCSLPFLACVPAWIRSDVGKIANDNVGETVSYVVAGVMPREMALEKLRFQKINDQIAFCSDASLAYLAFVRSYEVGGRA